MLVLLSPPALGSCCDHRKLFVCLPSCQYLATLSPPTSPSTNSPQRCLNDVNCKSFDAGMFVTGNPKIDFCFLSYENEADVKDTGAFVCDESFQMDYFEKNG